MPEQGGCENAGRLGGITSAVQLRARAGSAILFHQGLWHAGGPNRKPYHRYMMHMVYAPSWLRRTDRMHNSADFLQRTTPRRKQLMGEFANINQYLLMPAVDTSPTPRL
jgi:ectoine hydroxylase-related dioxygenase (phytanoyl-CoA dioxygenase family)